MITQTDVRAVIAREWSRYVALLRSMQPADWDRPTRLAGWSVRDLVAHTVWGASMEADAMRRWRTGDRQRTEGRNVEPTLMPQELLAVQVSCCDELAAELSRLGCGDPAQPVPMPYGDVPVDVVLDVFAMEAGVHAHDLGATLGDGRPLGHDVVQATANVLAAFLPTLASTDEAPVDGTTVRLRAPGVDLALCRADGGWSTCVRSDDDDTISAADASVLMLFALGRAPAESVTGPVAVRERFKTWFPGP
jgi:uncharacterized protein (TIGR03083 family)